MDKKSTRTERKTPYGLQILTPSTHYRSCQRRDFTVNHLHWYWQPNKNNQEIEHTKSQNNTTQKGALVNSTTHTFKKSRLRELTDGAWFSCLVRHPARKRSRSILTTPEPARGMYIPCSKGNVYARLGFVPEQLSGLSRRQSMTHTGPSIIVINTWSTATRAMSWWLHKVFASRQATADPAGGPSTVFVVQVDCSQLIPSWMLYSLARWRCRWLIHQTLLQRYLHSLSPAGLYVVGKRGPVFVSSNTLR